MILFLLFQIYYADTLIVEATRLHIDPYKLPFFVEEVRFAKFHPLLFSLNLSSFLLNEYGGYVQLATSSIQGLSSTNTLITVNGLPLNTLKDNTFDLSLIPLCNLKRAEVIHSGYSLACGAHGLNLINITYDADEKSNFRYFRGNYSEEMLYMSIRRGTNPLFFGGLDAHNGKGFRDNSDFTKSSGVLGFTYSINDWEINLLSGGCVKKYGVPGPSPDTEPSIALLSDKQQDRALFLTLSGKLLKKNFSLNVISGYAVYLIDYKSAYGEDTIYSDILNFSANLSKPPFYLNFDARNYKAFFRSSGFEYYDKREWECGASLTFFRKIFKPFLLTGIRFDKSSRYKGKFSGVTGISVPFSFFNLYFSYSQGFQYPSFNDLYWPNTGWAEGNPELLPEKGKFYNAGIKMKKSNMFLNLNLFKNYIRDKIEWVQDTDFVYRPKNLVNYEREGVEMVYKFSMLKVEYIQNLLFFFKDYEGIPRVKFVMTLRYKSFLTPEITYIYRGKMHKAYGDKEKILNDYHLLNIGFVYQFRDFLNIYLRCENLFDVDYKMCFGFSPFDTYPGRPRIIHIGIGMKF